MAAHVHGHTGDRVTPPSPRRLRLLLAAVLLPLVALTALGVALLAGSPSSVALPPGLGPGGQLIDAAVVDRVDVSCRSDETAPVVPLPVLAEDQVSTADATQCFRATLRLQTGPDEGREIVLDVLSVPTKPFPGSGGVVLAYQEGSEERDRYVFVDVQRDTPLLLLGAAFAAAVLVVGRWSGLRALVGLALSLLVVCLFVLPALLDGRSPVLVALVGSAAVMLVSLYVTHGVTTQTSIAVLGTFASLLLTVGLAQIVVPAARLTGTETGEATILTGIAGVDLRGLLLAGIVIGSLGVLDDVTVTQAATVWELHRTDPRLDVRHLIAAGMRVGRQHLGATVNTLALAYVGAALPLLVVVTLVGSRAQDTATREVVAQELVRALTGSLGIIAAIPLTTALAAIAVRAASPQGPVETLAASDQIPG